jgi:ATP-dependent RNA helicase DDX35
LSSLTIVPTSYASAQQRAGRAGRTAPGICYRLYPQSVLSTLPRTSAPEIVRSDLTTPILQLKALGIDDLVKFEWVTNPPAESVLRALEGLVNSGMVDPESGRLTEIGEKVAECPVEVGVARMVNRCSNLSFVIWFLTTPCATQAIQLEGIQMWRRDTDDCRDDLSAGMEP